MIGCPLSATIVSGMEPGDNGGLSSLDQRTQLGKLLLRAEDGCGWWFTHWPDCGEASVVWRSGRVGSAGKSTSEKWRRFEPTDGGGLERDPVGSWWVSEEGELRIEGDGPWPEDLKDAWYPEQDVAAIWKSANSRAAARSRRYFVRNRLRYMWVLTYAVRTTDRRVVMGQVSDFARRLRSKIGRGALPYWYSPELHPGGHGWHVNFFIAERQAHSVIAELWGQGHVWVSDFAKSNRGPKGEPLGLCRTPRDGWRRAARYGCKYAQKDWSPEHVGRQSHRYEVAQGFAPTPASHWVRSKSSGDGIVADLVPEEDRQGLAVWDSDTVAEWAKPPVRTWRW